MAAISLPNNWHPRPYQLPLWEYLENGGKRAFALWHRRAGKDDLCLHWAAVSMVQRVGTYWHMLPEAAQARKAIWKAINPHTGKRRIDEAFPHELRASTNDQEMFIQLKNGSTWQVIGSDNFNSLVGSPPVGVVFSEWALANPAAWAYIRPIFAENGGWALFITTPRGKNHAYTMFQSAKNDPDWYAQELTASETRVFTPEQLTKERAELVREHGEDQGEGLFQQEYYVSFTAAIFGAYYGKEMGKAEAEGRIGRVPYDKEHKVHTAWDLGKGGNMAVVVFQIVRGWHQFIDEVRLPGGGIPDFWAELKKRPYADNFGQHIGPHDLKQTDPGSGKTRLQFAEEAGLRFTVLPIRPVDDGISVARQLLQKCRFDAKGCAHLVEALKQYQREWDDENKVFKTTPKHDWASHPADAFRYAATANIDNGDYAALMDRLYGG